MNFKLHKINRLSGIQASVYTVTLEGDAGSLFERFLQEYRDEFPEETKDLLLSLQTMGHKTGDPNLSKQTELLMQVADKIHERFAEHDLQWAPGMRDITGDLDFREDEDDQS